MVLWLALVAGALGQATATDRPVVPSAGLAAEGGPGALWVNPANLAYDPDRRFGLFFSQDVTGPGRTALAGTWGIGLVQAGVHALVAPTGGVDWSLDVAGAIPLPKRLSLGIRLDWHLLEERENYIGWDAALSWRPLPWFGLAAVTRNIASPSPGAVAQSGFGLAVRPFGDTLVVATDYLHAFPGPWGPLPSGIARDLLQLSLRVRPTEGLYVRASLDTRLRAGLGVEVYFGGYGGGTHAAASLGGDAGFTAFVGTDEPGETLVRSRQRVPGVDLQTLPAYQPRASLLRRTEPGWLDTLELLRRLETERSIQAVTIALGTQGDSWARSSELRTRIVKLQEAGKRVVVYLYGDPSPSTYYVASAAEKILLHPAASVQLRSPSVSLTYAGGALERFGVEAQVARRSDYKAASEPLTHRAPSDAQLEQTRALVDDLHAILVAAIAHGRGVDEATARRWVEEGPWTGAQALELGLIDGRAYPDQVDAALEGLLGFKPRVSELKDTPQPRSAWEAPSQIAVIHVEGLIVGGESRPRGPLQPGVTGSTTVTQLLEQATKNPQVRAIVLRVDSPGGSAFASDEIWRAVEKARRAGKPVVATFGGTAASGGYYVAAGADKVFAEATTLTGSIGVLVTKVSAAPALERLGITTTTVGATGRGDPASPFSAWDEHERGKVQDQVDFTYDLFVDRVVAGRKLDRERVEAAAQGRVWSGERAHALGLVDGLGGFDEAIAEARRLAGIRPGRKVALVTYTDSGLKVEALAPALVLGPHAPGAAASLPRALDLLWEPMLMWGLLADEGLLLVEPTLLGGPR